MNNIYFPYYWDLNDDNEIYIFSKTIDNQDLYIGFGKNDIIYLKFDNDVTINDIEEMIDNYDCDGGLQSSIDQKYIALENPDFDLLNDNPTWIKSLKNKYGNVYSFIIYNRIKPYGCIYIKEDEYSGYNIEMVEYDKQPIYNELFWDIEVYSDGQFPDPKNPLHPIIFISVVIDNGINDPEIYLFYQGTIGNQVNITKVSNMNVNYMYYDNEKGLIVSFINLLSTFKADFIYGYNDLSFDYEYLYHRCILHNIEITNIGKELDSKWLEYDLPTPFGKEFKHRPHIPGTNLIDMLYYVRKWYPSLHNHKLDTISSLILNYGKTGLKIDDMMRYYREQDQNGMQEVAKYSIQDAVLLRDLRKTLNMRENIEKYCNSISDTYYESLIASPFTSINKFMSTNDFYYLFTGSRNIDVDTKSKLDNDQVYTNINIYDPSNIYKHIINTITNIVNVDYLPPAIISTLFYSSYTNVYKGIGYLKKMLKSQNIMEISKNKIITKDNINMLDLVIKYKKYLQFSSTNYIIMFEDSEILKNGQSKNIKANIPYLDYYIDQLINNIFDINSDIPMVMTNYTIEKLAVDIRIKNKNNYNNEKNVRYILSSQYEKIHEPVETWVTVKAYKIRNDPGYILKESYNPNLDIIDLKYYSDMLKKIYQQYTKVKK